MSLKDFVRKIVPEAILEWNRRRKKEQRNSYLSDQNRKTKEKRAQNLI